MPINLTTTFTQQREVFAQERLRASFGRTSARRFFNELQMTSRAAAAAVSSGAGSDATAIAMNGTQERTFKLLSTTYQEVFPVFGVRTIEAIVPGFSQTQAFSSSFETAISQYIADYGALKTTQINSTTRANLNKILTEAFDEGLSVNKTALKIVEETGTINRTRAIRIARTEVHSASNAASVSSTDGLNLALDKMWLAALNRTRQTHLDANKQEVHKDGDFLVGQSLLRYPGDPLGPAKEIINCRCVIGWVTEQ